MRSLQHTVGSVRGATVLVAVFAMVLFATPVGAAEVGDQLVPQDLEKESAPSKLTDQLQRELDEVPPGVLGSEQLIDVKILSDLSSSEAEELATALGGTLRLSAGGSHWMRIPAPSVPAMARIPSIDYIAPAEKPYALADTSEGVATMGVSEWSGSGLTGSGIDVGVIDLGFSGYNAAIAAGDLPSGLVTQNYCANFQGTSHGTGVAEIVHDVAPDANLHLICIEDVADLSNAVSYAQANGIDVINHSVGWFNSSRGDGTGGAGTPEGIAEDAVDSGIVWVNAAGNHADRHWKGKYDDTDSNGFHEYAVGDETNAFVLGAFQSVSIFLKWDKWPTTSLDYDLYLWDHGSSTFVAASTDFQTGSQPPVEEITFTNPTGTPMVLGAAINKVSGSGKPRMDLFITLDQLQYPSPTGSLLEPAGHPDLVTVGATCWDGDALASYSSRGPNIAGVTKPNVSAPTGVTTFAYGAGNSTCTSGFTGTSSAAPHAAGMAALILEGKPSLSPAGVTDRLEANVLDLGPAGKDNRFGAGRLEAFGLCDGEVASVVGTDGNDNLTGTSKRDVIAGYGGGDVIRAKGGNDLICGGNGPDTIYGGNGADKLRGQGGDDLLIGGAGNDKYIGGGGQNTASFKSATGSVTASLAAGEATGEGSDTLQSIIDLIGSSHADVLTGNGQPNLIEGMGGKDTIVGGNGSDLLKGGRGDDHIEGGSGSDTLRGQGGSDVLRGQGGSDLLIGGSGDDDQRGGAGNDTVSYGEAPGSVAVDLLSQVASGSWGLDLLKTIENLIGSDFADDLFGDDGPNVIDGGAGDDDVRGRAGDDTLNGQAGTDVVHGGPGTDACSGFETVFSCE